LRLIAKQAEKFQAIANNLQPEAFNGLINAIMSNKTYGATLQNTFIDLCVNHKKEKADAIRLSVEELLKLRNIVPAKKGLMKGAVA